MRKYYVLVLILVGFIPSIIAQEEQNAGIPKVFPVSPQAGSLGNYGNLPIDLCTGKSNFTIPIYTIKINDFEYPINLSYNYSGLQSEDIIGHVGTGWTISSSGYISTQIRGSSDFGSLGYLTGNIGKNLVKPYLDGVWNSLPANELQQKTLNLFSGSSSGRLDTEPDKFIVNAGNLNCSFFLNEVGNTVFYEKKNYKIDYTRNSNNPNFNITDDRGIKYNFNKFESTITEQGDSFLTQKTAFNLTSINLPENKNITFNYSPSYYIKKTYSDRYKVNTTIVIGNIPTNPCMEQTGASTNQIENTIETNIISDIVYDNVKITFTYDNLENNLGERLKFVTIYNQFNEIVNRYNFIYDSNKKLLLEVKKDGANNIQEPFYKFEYYGSIPEYINPKSQDLWGFYNGANNQYLVTGNKKINFDNTLLGTLKKIIYPTKGYSEIAYEQNTTDVFPYFEDCTNVEFVNQVGILARSGGSNNFESQDVEQTIFIPYNQTVKVKLSSYAGGGLTGLGETEASVGFVSAIGSLQRKFLFCSPDFTNSTASYREGTYIHAQQMNKTLFVNFGPGNIIIKASSTNSMSSNSISTVDVFYNVEVPKFYKVGGLRIKSIKDCSDETNCISNNYDYHNQDGTSNGKLLYKSIYSENNICNYNGYLYGFNNYFGNSLVPLSSYSGNPVLYSKVLQSVSSSNIINGSTEYNFSWLTLVPSITVPLKPMDKFEYKKGKLLVKTIKNLNQDIIVNETNQFENITDINKTALGFKSLKFITNFIGQGSSAEFVPDFKTVDYLYHENDYRLKQKLESNYLETSQVNFNTDFEYNLLNQVSSKKISSSNNEILETKFFYPQDLEMINEPFKNDLITKNIIGLPLDTQTFKAGVKISEQKTIFANDATTSNLLLPKTVLASKGTQNLETKLTYNNYDTKGNITQYTPENGVPTSIIWGYNQTQPIAKIENATYASVQNQVTNLQTLSNTGTEANLLIALNNLRANLPNAMVTTYTHKPLIGVSTITDPKGDKITYNYDSFNRLLNVTDKNGNILTENQYNYKP